MLSLPIIGDEVGKIIFGNHADSFEGDVLLSSTYSSLSPFYRLELLSDVIAVLQNEYERVMDEMAEDLAERKAEMSDEEFAE